MAKKKENGRSEGFVYIHKQIMESELWELNGNAIKIALYMLMEANFANSKRSYNGIMRKRGQLIKSYNEISKACGISVRTVHTQIQELIRIKFISAIPSGNSNPSLFTITKYDDFQNQKSGKKCPILDQDKEEIWIP